jgi:hypothetical protein
MKKQDAKDEMIRTLIGKINREHMPHLAKLLVNTVCFDKDTSLIKILNEKDSEDLKKSFIKEIKALVSTKKIDLEVVVELFPENKEIFPYEFIEIKKECINLLYSIKESGWGDNDSYTVQFHNEKINTLENINNLADLKQLKEELIKVEKAVTSDEIIALKLQVKRLNAKKNHFFGTNNLQKKIHAINEAVYQVPLRDRIHVFTNQQNTQCLQVQKALNMHRYSLWSNLKSPESYAELHKEFPNKLGDDTNKL